MFPVGLGIAAAAACPAAAMIVKTIADSVVRCQAASRERLGAGESQVRSITPLEAVAAVSALTPTPGAR